MTDTQAVELHVAVDGSNDHPGTAAAPFATLDAACDAIRGERGETTYEAEKARIALVRERSRIGKTQ